MRRLPCCLPLAGLIATAVAAAPARLERGNGPEPSTLDAHRCQEIACSNILRDLYTGLVSEAADGRLEPGLAESWAVSADGLEWRFTLREGLRWSNSEPLDAAQIVASFHRAFAPATAAPMAGLLAAIDHAQAVQTGTLPPSALGIDAPDPRTVVFRLSRPAPLPALLVLPIAFPLYLPALEQYGTRHTRPGRLVGTGAYQLVDWVPQAHVTLRANPHALEPPAIDTVRFHVTEDAASELKRFAAGDLHITETLPPVRLEQLRERFGPALRIAPYLGTFWFGLNLERPPLRDSAALREALNLALDRERLTRYITGLGEAPAYAIVPPALPGYPAPRPDWADWPRERREALARERYAAAGYGAERPLRLELRFNTSVPHRRLALAVAAMWREVLGVTTVLRNEEWKVFVVNRRQRVITQVFRGGWIADVADPADFLAAFASDGALNWSGYRDAEFSRLFDAAQRMSDPASRAALLAHAEQRLLDAHAVLPIYHYASRHLVDPRLEGWVDNPLDRHPSRHLRWRRATP